ncbi:AAA family ATPase, partial [Asanoa sp. NPDC050611]|uniref:AAA family ATPase n=1 Tax=Asanoa sp. NPDC050611 TaxID=3157098 RepID=UPI0033F3339A
MTDLTFFTSRPWLQDRVDGWLAGGPDVGRVLVISGGPGTGKSRFLHELCRDLTDSPPPGGVQLAGAILRDLRGNRSDELSWAKLKSELLKLVGSPSPTISHPSALVHQNVETIAPGAQVIGQMITALLLNNDPLQELREAVLPLLADLPSGPPLLLVVDGLDEAFRDQAMEFLSVVSRLADAISRAPDGQKGIGRLRILVASQPEVPIEINPLRPPVTVDLARPDDSDQADLTRYCTALLADLPSDHRETLAHEIAKNAAGVWVWAFYVATTVAEDFANGEPIPRTVTAPRSLQEVYREALERARSRLRDRWQTGAELIALVAASQDVGAMLPKDIALAVLGVDGAGLANLLKDLKALVAPTSKGEYRFWHGDFGRWIVEGGYELANVRDAHDRLANFTVQVGTGGWSFAGPYARNYVMPHALAAAESDLGSVQLRSSLGRCLQLLQEVDLLAEDADCPGEYPNVRNWLDYLQRLSCITPGATRIAGAAPLTGLTSTLYRLLQSHVGARLAARMSDAQLQRFSALLEDGEQQGALALLDDVQPTRVVVAEELRRLWGRVLNGWRPAVDLGWSAFMVAIDLRRQWQATKVPSLLDRAIEAYEESLQHADPEAPYFTDRMIGFANSLIRRVGTEGERPDDLDRLILAQAEILGRQDLEGAALVSAQSVTGFWLEHRWLQDPEGHSDDLDSAVEAYTRALSLSSDDADQRIDLTTSLVRALGRRIDTPREATDDLDRVIALQAQVVGRLDRKSALAYWVCGFWLDVRWGRDPDGRGDDLDHAVEAYLQALELTPPDDPMRTDRMIGLANGLNRRLGTDGERSDDLDRLVALHSEIAARPDLSDPGQAHEFRGNVLEQRWERDPEGRRGDLDAAVEAYAQALELTAADDPQRTDRMISVANGLTRRVGTQGERSDDLDRLVALHSEIAGRSDLRDPGNVHEFRGNVLEQRWKRDPEGRRGDLDAAVEAYAQALELTAADDPQRT